MAVFPFSIATILGDLLVIMIQAVRFPVLPDSAIRKLVFYRATASRLFSLAKLMLAYRKAAPLPRQPMADDQPRRRRACAQDKPPIRDGNRNRRMRLGLPRVNRHGHDGKWD